MLVEWFFRPLGVTLVTSMVENLPWYFLESFKPPYHYLFLSCQIGGVLWFLTPYYKALLQLGIWQRQCTWLKFLGLQRFVWNNFYNEFFKLYHFNDIETLGHSMLDNVQPWVYCTVVIVIPLAKMEWFDACSFSYISAFHTNFTVDSRVTPVLVEYRWFLEVRASFANVCS